MADHVGARGCTSAAKCSARCSEAASEGRRSARNLEECMSRIGKKPVVIPSGVTAKLDGKTIAVKGAKGELKFTAPDEVAVTHRGRRDSRRRRTARTSARARCGARRARGSRTWSPASPRASRRSSRSTASATRRRWRARTCSSRSATATTWSIRSRPASRSSRPKPTEITIAGIDKRQVGQIAAEIRALPRPRALQGQGRQIRRRVHLPQGRQEEVRGAVMAKSIKSTERRKARVRRAIARARGGRPRLSVFRSSKQIYAQVIDDEKGVTLAAASSLEKAIREALKTGADIDAAKRDRQGDRRARQEGRRRPRSCSTAAATCITGASRRSPRAPARAASSSKV